MKIGIIGLGQVGETLQYGFRRIGHDVIGHDLKHGTKIQDVLQTQVCFICVPTPNLPTGKCDVSIVDKVCYELHELRYSGATVIKSTVPPGTTDAIAGMCPNLQLAFCPEFLRERARYSDFVENHDVCIIGCDQSDLQLYDWIKEAHGSLPKEFVWLSIIEAEFCKYFANCFNALRITFANEFADVCRAAGVDYRNVKNAIVKKKSIGDWYLDSSEHFRAFGGSCLPKDTEAFSHYATALGVSADLLDTAIALNDRETGKNVKAA